MHPSLSEQAHRPWPTPVRPWTWRQSWLDLLFAHWRVAPESVRPLIPEPLEIDTYQGETFVGVVPFRMAGVTRRPLPPVPWLSAFPELNVRLYVRYCDKPGVFFLSLDADNPVAVWAARTFFRLPYFWSSMSIEGDAKSGYVYRSKRRMGHEPVPFEAMYRPFGESFAPERHSLEEFLVERYCLYTFDRRRRLLRGHVHHVPWPLQQVEATVEPTALLESHGIRVEGSEPLYHFSRGVDVILWGLESVPN